MSYETVQLQLNLCSTLDAHRTFTSESRLQLLEERSVQVVVAQRALADGAHSSLARREENSALVALPSERRLAEERRHLHHRQSLGPAPRSARLELHRRPDLRRFDTDHSHVVVGVESDEAGDFLRPRVPNDRVPESVGANLHAAIVTAVLDFHFLRRL